MRFWGAMLALAVVLLPESALAQTRRAFVAAVGDYRSLTDLQKTLGDASGYAQAFGDNLKFQVTQAPANATRAQFNAAFGQFLASIRPGDEVAFIFSGHGWSDGVENYLALSDAPRDASEYELKTETLALTTNILAQINARKPRLTLAIIDACRDNPFDNGTKAGFEKGLVRTEVAAGTMVVYAAGQRQKALDRLSNADNAQYSLFTRVLLPKLRDPALPLMASVDEARDEVARLAATINHQQRPAVYSDVSLAFCFAGTCRGATPPDTDTALWVEITSTDATCTDYERYRRQFPNGKYAGQAGRILSRAPCAAPAGAGNATTAGLAASPAGNVTSETLSASDTISAAKPDTQFTQAKGVCGEVIAIVYFEYDRASLTPEASSTLEGALRKTVGCIVERVVIEGHEDLGEKAAYAQQASMRRANAVADVLKDGGIDAARISSTGFGNTRPVKTGIASPLNRRVEVTLALSFPSGTVPKPAVSAPSSTPSSITQTNPTRRAGEAFRDCSDCPEMVSIPAGSFMMGSPASEAARNEGPQRRVSVPGFAAGKYEVTWAEWDRCVAAGSCVALKADGFGGGARPVTNVSWNEALTYTRWLSTRTAQTYRLLSEAEWEYAARAGSSGRWSFGDNLGSQGTYAWYNGNSGSATHPAGTKTANAFGLYDMHGNVSEWVQDCWADNYSAGQASDGSAFEVGSCPYRVYRGGSWDSDPEGGLRSAYRSWNVPTHRGISVGFRVARTL